MNSRTRASSLLDPAYHLTTSVAKELNALTGAFDHSHEIKQYVKEKMRAILMYYRLKMEVEPMTASKIASLFLLEKYGLDAFTPAGRKLVRFIKSVCSLLRVSHVNPTMYHIQRCVDLFKRIQKKRTRKGEIIDSATVAEMLIREFLGYGVAHWGVS